MADGRGYSGRGRGQKRKDSYDSGYGGKRFRDGGYGSGYRGDRGGYRGGGNQWRQQQDFDRNRYHNDSNERNETRWLGAAGRGGASNRGGRGGSGARAGANGVAVGGQSQQSAALTAAPAPVQGDNGLAPNMDHSGSVPRGGGRIRQVPRPPTPPILYAKDHPQFEERELRSDSDRIRFLEDEIRDIKNRQDITEDKVEANEQHSRNVNLRFWGIPPSVSMSKFDIFRKILCEGLKYSRAESNDIVNRLKNIHFLAGNLNCMIVAFMSELDRNEVFSRKTNLFNYKPFGMFINVEEDLTAAQKNEKRKCKVMYGKLRAKGFKVFHRDFDKLKVDGHGTKKFREFEHLLADQ